MKKRFTRRDFLRNAGIGAAGLALGPAMLKDVFGQQPKRRTLRILQWSHFVKRYDRWFDPYAKQWGEEHNVDVTVDHVGLADLRSTFASEVAAGKGQIVDSVTRRLIEPSVLDLTT